MIILLMAVFNDRQEAQLADRNDLEQWLPTFRTVRTTRSLELWLATADLEDK